MQHLETEKFLVFSKRTLCCWAPTILLWKLCQDITAVLCRNTQWLFTCWLWYQLQTSHSRSQLRWIWQNGLQKLFVLLQPSCSRQSLGTQNTSECWGEQCPLLSLWPLSQALVSSYDCHWSALSLSAGMLILYNELCILVLGAKLSFWISVLQGKFVLLYLGIFFFWVSVTGTDFSALCSLLEWSM